MGKLGKKLEELLSAASFAEEGEHDAAREMLSGRKKVLLVLTGRPADTRSCKYALNMAKRTDAGLELLITSDIDAARPALESCLEEIEREAVEYTVSKKSGCVKEAIISHTRKRSDLLCVVVESAQILDNNCSRKQRKLEGVYKEIGCPLTLVSERSSA